MKYVPPPPVSPIGDKKQNDLALILFWMSCFTCFIWKYYVIFKNKSMMWILIFCHSLICIQSDEFVGATNHPIHIHGHHVHILKIGYPEVDENTGLIVKETPDIKCAGKDCKYPSWIKEEWAGGNVPDLNLRNPPLKDTVVVPRMGYVVLRFPLDNPGI